VVDREGIVGVAVDNTLKLLDRTLEFQIIEVLEGNTVHLISGAVWRLYASRGFSACSGYGNQESEDQDARKPRN
jgi:hypothetical protein